LLTFQHRENIDPEGLEQYSRQRVKLQLGMLEQGDVTKPEIVLLNYEKYTVGTTRTLEEYQKASGVDFKHSKLDDRALWGGLSKTEFADYLVEVLMASLK